MKKNRFSVIQIVFLQILCVSSYCASPSFADEAPSAQEIYELLSWKASSNALNLVNQKLKTYPNCAELYVVRGTIFAGLHKNKLSMLDQNKALDIFEKDPSQYSALYKSNALHNRGTLFNRMGKKQEAEQDYLEAIKLFPSNSVSYVELGKMQFKQKRYSQAKDNLVKARELFVKQSNQEKVEEIDKLMPLVDKKLLKKDHHIKNSN